MLTRRNFTLGIASTAFGGLALSGCSILNGLPEKISRIPGYRTRTMRPFPGYGELQNDPAGLFDLPPGFEYQIISRYGDDLGDGCYVPDKADGMGSFRLDHRRMILVRNHELSFDDFARGPFPHGPPPDIEAVWRRDSGGQPQPGGTTTIVYDYIDHLVEDQYLSLVGTVRNCAGGTTPWGTWLTCEEEKGKGEHHGWVFEVPALRREGYQPKPIRSMGRFRHEAAAVDPRTGIVYLTEDDAGGLFYRYVPRELGRPQQGGRLLDDGRLEALAFSDEIHGNDSSNWDEPYWCERDPRNVRWIPLDGTDNPANDLSRRGSSGGALRFAYGEGIYLEGNAIYFCCTSGGRIKSGQIMRYVPSPHEGEGEAQEMSAPARLEIFLESTDPGRLNYADNLTVAPNGHLIVCEDPYIGGQGNYLLRELAESLRSESVCFVRGITPNGHVYDIARLRAWTELAGACFAPDGKTLFVNIHSPAKTLAITGPWQRPLPDWNLPQARCPA